MQVFDILPMGFPREIEGATVSIASLSSLVVLKAIACQNLLQHPNPFEKSKHRKHISDIIRLAYVMRTGDEVEVPSPLWPFLEAFLSNPASYFLPQRIRDSLWADYPDTKTRKTIKEFTPETFANIIRTYFRNVRAPQVFLCLYLPSQKKVFATFLP